MRISSPRTRVVLLLLALVPAACDLSDRSGEIEPQDPLWASVLERHTRGEISRRDRIRVAFSHDVVTDDRVGESAERILSVEPEIRGSVTFTSRREIAIAPEGELEPGSSYVVTLRRADLVGIPDELDRYRFAVRVMDQGFDVDVTGLSPDPDEPATLFLLGQLVTADVDDADRVERVVRARFGGADLDVGWSHDAGGRRHEFTVHGITRGQAAEDLTLAWDGSAIGVDRSGERRVSVPAESIFAVTRIDAVQGERQYVLVQFSDLLDSRQNLNGLVALGGAEFTTGIQANQIRVYPAEQTPGSLSLVLQPGIRSREGKRLESRQERTVTFAQTKPGVRFVGAGNIIPGSERLTIPIEAVNVRSVQVAAFAVPEDNMAQFLQTNALGGSGELGRVGRYLWRRTISLTSPVVDRWNRYALDLTELLRERGGLVRLSVSINRGNATYTCTEEDNAVPVVEEAPLIDAEEYD